MTEATVEELRQLVMQSHQKGDWPTCIDACKKLKDKFPENTGIAIKLAEVYTTAGEIQSAVKLYEEVATHYVTSGDFLKAIGVYKIILKLDPENLDSRKQLELLCSSENSEKKEWSLPEIPLLSDLKEEELKKVVHGLNHHSFDMGEIVCREGDEGTSLYIIVKGSVKVYIEGVAGEKIEITHLEEGNFFGEVGLLSGGRRKASVMAIDDTDLLEITKEELINIEKEHPRVKEVLQDFYKKRVLDKLMAVSPLFGSLQEEDRHDLLNIFVLQSFNDGDIVIKEGDAGSSLYIIKSGYVEVSTITDDNKKVVLCELKEGEFFGEVALLTGKPRTATVIARSSLELMELSGDDLNSCFKKHPKVKEVLNRYLKARVNKTISTIMALKDMDAREGLV